MTYFDIITRALVVFLILYILIRISGRKQISELTFFDYATGITIGAIAAYTCLSPRITLLQGMVGLGVWTALTMLSGYLALKSPLGRVLVEGEPVILIENGQVNKNAMKASRTTTDELAMLLRREKIFDFGKVAFAILEPNGKLSVLEKPEEKTLTRRDMMIPAPALKYLPTQVINDGRIIEENLKKLNLDRSWLDEQVKAQGYQVEDVFLAQMQGDGGLYLTPQTART